MTYYVDLSRYQYAKNFYIENSINVGWLDAEHAYTQGATPRTFLSKLSEFCRYSFVQTRGIHICSFCKETEVQKLETPEGQKLLLGGAEIRVLGKDGEVFCSPNLIYHYVAKHDYLPPASFIEAVMAGSKPTDDEYIDFFAQNDIMPEFTLKAPVEGARRRIMKTV